VVSGERGGQDEDEGVDFRHQTDGDFECDDGSPAAGLLSFFAHPLLTTQRIPRQARDKWGTLQIIPNGKPVGHPSESGCSW